VAAILGVPDLASAFFASGCADFGNAESTFEIL
jgi:hypothetical protein